MEEIKDPYLITQFWKYVKKTETCWLYLGHVGTNGYGQFWTGFCHIYAHRFSWALYNGPIPEGLNILHKTTCPHKNCVHPDHIYLGTQEDNAQDTLEVGHHRGANQTHCKNGHPLSQGNIDVYPTRVGIRRQCKMCARERNRRWLLRRAIQPTETN